MTLKILLYAHHVIQYMSLMNVCIEASLMGSQRESKTCIHVYYPNHPHVSQRTPCGTLLLKKLKPRQILG